MAGGDGTMGAVEEGRAASRIARCGAAFVSLAGGASGEAHGVPARIELWATSCTDAPASADACASVAISVESCSREASLLVCLCGNQPVCRVHR